MLESHVRCPHCHRDIARRPYLMAVDPDGDPWELAFRLRWFLVALVGLVACVVVSGL